MVSSLSGVPSETAPDVQAPAYVAKIASKAAGPQVPKKKGPPPAKFVRPPPRPPDIKQNSVVKKQPAAAVLGRRLHWDALQGNKIEGTVFQELNRDILLSEEVASLLDVDQMKRIFAKTGRPNARRGTVLGVLDNKRKILTGNRAQNIAIVLSRVPLPIETIAAELRTMNAGGLVTRDIVEKILDIAPLPDEIEEYNKFMSKQEDIETLRDVEKKYFPLFGVERLRERCKLLLAHLRFPEVESDVMSMLTVLYDAGSQVRKSQKFRALLVAVLLWGNFVNHGVQEPDPSITAAPKTEDAGPKEDAYGRRRRRAGTAALEIRTFGFTLPSLLKLAEFKTTVDPSITSLHYIIANMIQSQPKVQLHLLLEEMLSVPKAARIPASALKECLATLQSELTFVKTEYELSNCEAVYGTSGRERLGVLLDDMKGRLSTTQDRYSEVTSFVGETAAYFGDIKAKSRPDSHEDFFKTLHLFLVKFQMCVADYQQNTRKFKDILIESAQNRGLTYIQSEGPTTNTETTSLKKGTLTLTKPVGKKCSALKATPAELATTHRAAEDCEKIKTPYVRAAGRRASVGAVRHNVVLPTAKYSDTAKRSTPTTRDDDPSESACGNDQPQVSSTNRNVYPRRSVNRRSTAVGTGFYGLQSSAKRTPVALPPPLPHMRITSGSDFELPSSHILQGDIDHASRIPRSAEVPPDSSTTLQLPVRRMSDAEAVSDTELDLRKTRQYVVDPSPFKSSRHPVQLPTSGRITDAYRKQESHGLQEVIDADGYRIRTRKKTEQEQAVSDKAYRKLGRILHALDKQSSADHSYGPSGVNHTRTPIELDRESRERQSTLHVGVYAAFDEAVETFMREHIHNNTVEDFLRLESQTRNLRS